MSLKWPELDRAPTVGQFLPLQASGGRKDNDHQDTNWKSSECKQNTRPISFLTCLVVWINPLGWLISTSQSTGLFGWPLVACDLCPSTCIQMCWHPLARLIGESFSLWAPPLWLLLSRLSSFLTCWIQSRPLALMNRLSGGCWARFCVGTTRTTTTTGAKSTTTTGSRNVRTDRKEELIVSVISKTIEGVATSNWQATGSGTTLVDSFH